MTADLEVVVEVVERNAVPLLAQLLKRVVDLLWGFRLRHSDHDSNP